MKQPPEPMPRFAPFRWVLLVVLVGSGLGLFLWYAPDAEPVAHPSTVERPR